MSALIPREGIEQTILVIRGHNVMLDSDLAHLYGVTAGRLNEAVKRNEDRFPSDFMFQLTKPEFEHLKSQIAISSSTWGGRRHAPYAFTEQGVAMLSSVLHSKRAIQVNIAIMRAFVQLRAMIASNKGLARRLDELEKKYDGQFLIVFEAIRELMAEPESKPRRIGFKT
ncbi:MAG TPA: ORF6N domain-containing protein [Nitrospiraceae bacterium]|nr:ORF6N domain-containing protein [Nitrospiraceae bacterium]